MWRSCLPSLRFPAAFGIEQEVYGNAYAQSPEDKDSLNEVDEGSKGKIDRHLVRYLVQRPADHPADSIQYGDCKKEPRANIAAKDLRKDHQKRSLNCDR